MKKIFASLLICCCLLLSCSNTTPQQFFNVAVLNSNLLYGFAGNGLQRELISPTVKLVNEKTMKTAPMTRAEVVKEKLVRAEENYQKVKSLGQNAAADEMLKASTALYEFVIPVYKNEYSQLAKLYDDNAPAEKITAAEKDITDRYETKFLELYNAASKAGMAYAEKNGIRIQQVNPSPSH